MGSSTGEARGPRHPCRLTVLLARAAPVGVVLRRGPSDWARLSRWHTDTDQLEHGQWARVRVYERRCDVSADGSLFVYFARRARAPAPDRAGADSWIAVSRPPWFTALALWFVGGTYCAGGCFPDGDSLYIGMSDPPDQGTLPAGLPRAVQLPHVRRSPNWTEEAVFFNRLRRDGWAPVPDTGERTWQRPHPTRGVTLEFTDRGWDARAYGGPRGGDYALRSGAEVWPLNGVRWADWDARGRLTATAGGRLLVWDPASGDAAGTWREIADLNDQAPAPVASPSWARSWPERPLRGTPTF
jgi:hypothetical protein